MKNNRLTDIFLHKNPQINQSLRVMKITFLFLFVCIFSIYAENSYSQNARVSINKSNVQLEEILNEIEKQTDYLFFYNNQVNVNEKVSVKVNHKPVNQLLNDLLKNGSIHYAMEGTHIILSKKTEETESKEGGLTVLQQKRKISGIIKDQHGEPMVGAAISVKGNPTIGVNSDIDGNFELEVPSGFNTITVSLIGFEKQEINIEGKTRLEIILKEDSQILEEVVVTALGIKRSEKALGYSAQKVGGEELTNVKGVDIGTSLSGKIAGVTVLNTNQFNSAPSILLRGSTPLIVIDGVPFSNTGLSDLAADDIESMTVLKGATASALYGSQGGNGAIMITTKRGSKEGLTVSVNSSTMFNLGYLVIPEVQGGYSSGEGGKYRQGKSEYVWGDKLDIGRTAIQYDPQTYEWREMPLVSKGKDNFKNFLETSFITNNNVSLAYKAANSSVRTSFTHIYNKGQYPGNKLNKFTYNVAGDMKVGKFSMDASITYNGSYTPQYLGEGYSGAGYMYNLIVWSGPDFDLRDFKNYWVKGKENQTQNWHYDADYNNPYYLANEATQSQLKNRANGQATANYEITNWLKSTVRVGSDFYTTKYEMKTPLDMRNSWTGRYQLYDYRGYSVTGDGMLLADKNFGDFSVGGLAGAGTSYYEDDVIYGTTNGGLLVPGFYSLKSSVKDPSVTKTINKKRTNSLYGKVDFSWKSTAYLEVTARNDWSSTLDASERSYFYPSVSGSFIASELFDMPTWLSYLKLRGSWTLYKSAPSIYAINKVYTVETNSWDGNKLAYYPTSIRDVALQPSQMETFEVGGTVHFLDNRLRLDVAYYRQLQSKIQYSAPLSYATGFSSSLINYGEERVKKGWEVTLFGEILKTRDWKWNATFNWGMDRYYYHKLDEDFSTDKPWVKKGERWDYLAVTDWERDPDGNIVHGENGLPVLSNYTKKIGHERADWVWGFNNHISYKSFTLDFSVDGRVGGKAYNRTEQAMWNSGTHPDSDNQWRYDEVVNGKTNYIGKGVKVVSGSVKYDSYGNILEDTRTFAPNDTPVSYTAYTQTYNPWNGSARIQNYKDLTFIKLREISVGYNVPKAFIGKIGLKSAHVALVGQNLLFWAKEFKYSDPDAVYEGKAETLNSPAMRYVGVNIKFDF